MHPARFMWIFANAQCLWKDSRVLVRRKIMGLLARFHHVPLLVDLCIKIPFSHYRKANIRLHLDRLVQQTTPPDWQKRYIKANLRIVHTKRQSIAGLMCSPISSTKAVTTEPPPRTCAVICKLLKVSRDAAPMLPALLDGHVGVRAGDLPPRIWAICASASQKCARHTGSSVLWPFTCPKGLQSW